MKRFAIAAALLLALSIAPVAAQQMIGPGFNLSSDSAAYKAYAESSHQVSAEIAREEERRRCPRGDCPPAHVKTTAEIQREAEAGWAYARAVHPSWKN